MTDTKAKVVGELRKFIDHFAPGAVVKIGGSGKGRVRLPFRWKDKDVYIKPKKRAIEVSA